MSDLSLKEKAVIAVIGTVLLYALAVVMWFMFQEKAWKKSAKDYSNAKDRYADECKMIARRSEIFDQYETEKSQMPTFDINKATDTTWLSKLDELFEKHHLVVTKRQAGKETENGEVRELQIDVRDYEAALEQLVRFMHEVENTEEGMFDIGSLSIKTSSKKGYLKGSFTITCAYMRGED